MSFGMFVRPVKGFVVRKAKVALGHVACMPTGMLSVQLKSVWQCDVAIYLFIAIKQTILGSNFQSFILIY